MKIIKKVFGLAMVFLLSTSMYAGEIHVTVYGKGGIVIKPDGTKILCPNTSTAVCNEITMPSDPATSNNGGNGIPAVMEYNGKTYNVLVIEFYNLSNDEDGLKSNGVKIKLVGDENIN